MPSSIFKYAAYLAYCYLLVVLLNFPIKTLEYNAPAVVAANQTNKDAFYGAENTLEGKRYVWTRPDATIYFLDAPRYAPLLMKLEINLQRPPGTPTAKVDLVELQDSVALPLKTLQLEQNGFNTYEISIPVREAQAKGFTLQIKSNTFRVSGDGRDLGVMLADYSLEMKPTQLRWLLFPQPFLLAFGVLILGILFWAFRTSLDHFEILLLLTGISIITGLYAYALVNTSWWRLVAGLLVVASSQWWRIKSLREREWGEIAALLLSCAGLCLFFFSQPPGVIDIVVYSNWLNDAHTYGIWDYYSNSPQFQYPPLIIYIFWLLGLLLSWLGINDSSNALKILFTLFVPLCLWLVERLVKQTTVDLQKKRATLLLVAFGGGPVFNAAVWGQTEPALTFLMLLSFSLMLAGRYVGGSLMAGTSLLFKPQALFFLPVLGATLWRKVGWRKVIVGAFAALGLILVIGLPAFGFRPESIHDFIFQSRFAGGENSGSINAFNLYYLFGYNQQEVPGWLAVCGLALFTAVYLVIIWITLRRESSIYLSSFAMGLTGAAFFLFFLKVHERYLEYGLIWLAMAALFNPRLYKPALGLGLVSLTNMAVVYSYTKRGNAPEVFYTWAALIAQNLTRPFISLLGLLLFCYIFLLYLEELVRPLSKVAPITVSS